MYRSKTSDVSSWPDVSPLQGGPTSALDTFWLFLALASSTTPTTRLTWRIDLDVNEVKRVVQRILLPHLIIICG